MGGKNKREMPERYLLHGRIIDLGEHLRYLAPSDEHSDVAYMVDLLAGECSCPDCQIEKHQCKHIYRAYIYFAKQMVRQIRREMRLIAAKKTHQTHKR